MTSLIINPYGPIMKKDQRKIVLSKEPFHKYTKLVTISKMRTGIIELDR